MKSLPAITVVFASMLLSSCTGEEIGPKEIIEYTTRVHSIKSLKFSDSLSSKSIIEYLNSSTELGSKSDDHEKFVSKFCNSVDSVFEFHANKVRIISTDTSSAIYNINLALKNCTSDKGTTKYASLQNKINEIQSLINKRKSDIRELSGIKKREHYAIELRNHYLDNGDDIKVSLSGKSQTEITLKFILFGAVAARKVQTSGLLDEIKGMGFKKLSMSNGHDWEVFWDL